MRSLFLTIAAFYLFIENKYGDTGGDVGSRERRHLCSGVALCDKTIWNCLLSLICQKCLAVAVDDVADDAGVQPVSGVFLQKKKALAELLFF